MQTASADGQNKLVNGTISIVFLKDPTDPQWKNDGAIKLYRKILTQYAPERDPADPLHVYGMAAAWTAADALKKAGKNLTRASLLQALDTLTATGNPFMLPGHRRQDGGEGSLSGRADAAAAVAERHLELVRRALGVPRLERRLAPFTDAVQHTRCLLHASA